MARYNDYVFDYSLAIPGEDETYSYSHSQGQSRLHSSSIHMPVREVQRSPTRYVPHTSMAPNTRVSRPTQIEYINISPIDTRYHNNFGQQHQQHFPTSPISTINRSPTNYDNQFGDEPYRYNHSSHATDSRYASTPIPFCLLYG